MTARGRLNVSVAIFLDLQQIEGHGRQTSLFNVPLASQAPCYCFRDCDDKVLTARPGGTLQIQPLLVASCSHSGISSAGGLLGRGMGHLHSWLVSCSCAYFVQRRRQPGGRDSCALYQAGIFTPNPAQLCWRPGRASAARDGAGHAHTCIAVLCPNRTQAVAHQRADAPAPQS